MGSAPSELSIVNVTSARPSGARPDVPAKMTSSIFPPRSALAPCSPSTQLMASTTLDFPDPFGPTTQVMPGSRRSVVAEAKDLKPFSVRLLRCTGRLRGEIEVPRAYRPDPARPGRSGPRSGFGEAAEPAAGLPPALDDVVDPAGRVVAAEGVEQFLTGTATTLRNHRHPAVREVARLAHEAELQGPTARPPAKTDTLHVPVHPGGQSDRRFGHALR